MRNQIDFSKLERIEPRESSWDMVCARLDSSEHHKFIDFIKTRTKYILAACFAIAAFVTAFMTFNIEKIENVLIKNVTSDELISWYGDLGETSDDELENLDKHNTISILLEEIQ